MVLVLTRVMGQNVSVERGQGPAEPVKAARLKALDSVDVTQTLRKLGFDVEKLEDDKSYTKLVEGMHRNNEAVTTEELVKMKGGHVETELEDATEELESEIEEEVIMSESESESEYSSEEEEDVSDDDELFTDAVDMEMEGMVDESLSSDGEGRKPDELVEEELLDERAVADVQITPPLIAEVPVHPSGYAKDRQSHVPVYGPVTRQFAALVSEFDSPTDSKLEKGNSKRTFFRNRIGSLKRNLTRKPSNSSFDPTHFSLNGREDRKGWDATGQSFMEERSASNASAPMYMRERSDTKSTNESYQRRSGSITRKLSNSSLSRKLSSLSLRRADSATEDTEVPLGSMYHDSGTDRAQKENKHSSKRSPNKNVLKRGHSESNVRTTVSKTRASLEPKQVKPPRSENALKKKSSLLRLSRGLSRNSRTQGHE